MLKHLSENIHRLSSFLPLSIPTPQKKKTEKEEPFLFIDFSSLFLLPSHKDEDDPKKEKDETNMVDVSSPLPLDHYFMEEILFPWIHELPYHKQRDPYRIEARAILLHEIKYLQYDVEIQYLLNKLLDLYIAQERPSHEEILRLLGMIFLCEIKKIQVKEPKHGPLSRYLLASYRFLFSNHQEKVSRKWYFFFKHFSESLVSLREKKKDLFSSWNKS